MGIIWQTTILAFIAFAMSMLVYPFVLKFAVKHDILDNPDFRKLQRRPVPVMGGVTVYIGLMVAIVVSFFAMNSGIMAYGLMAMTVMMLVGCWDDVSDLPPTLRFIIEVAVIWVLMYAVKARIDNFHGLWGIHSIGDSLSLPLSLVAGVGIINAINLIDGVNGYSSGYGMMACFFFAAEFFFTGNYSMGTLCVVTGSAVVPFFLHNVFGKSSRMFIGDGGTLMLGTLLALCVFCTLSGKSPSAALESKGIGLVAFSLAVLGLPVFDTLRVMTARIVRGFSPFKPDKTHLHHLFIDCGFSHIGTAITILFSQLILIFIWWLTWKLGGSIDLQFYVVVAVAMFDTFVFYRMMRISQAHNGKLFRWFVKFGDFVRVNEHKPFKAFRRFIDSKSIVGIDYNTLIPDSSNGERTSDVKEPVDTEGMTDDEK